MTQVVVEAIASGTLLALVSLGLALVYRSSQVLHLAHASAYSVGGYAGVILFNKLGGLPWLAAMGAMATAAVLGTAIETLVYRPLRRRGSPPEVLFLASIGIVSIVSGTIGLAVGSDLLLARIAVGEEVLRISTARISHWRSATTVVGVILLAGSTVALTVTKLGVWIRALVSDPILCRSMGLQVNRVRLVAMAVGSGLAGFAAFCGGADTAFSPQSGFRMLLLAFTAMIVGGTDRLSGPILGGFVVALIQQTTSRYWNPAWQDGVVFAILIALLLLRPRGVVGTWR